jgi:hypothetical protein
MKPVIALKSVHGENILAEMVSVLEESGTIYLRRPVEVKQQMQMTPIGLYPVMVPTLYFPFGEQQIYPFAASHFVAIVPASDFDIRWYQNTLQVLYAGEIKRMLTQSAVFDDYDYADKMIMAAPETLQ